MKREKDKQTHWQTDNYTVCPGRSLQIVSYYISWAYSIDKETNILTIRQTYMYIQVGRKAEKQKNRTKVCNIPSQQFFREIWQLI